MKFLTSLIPEKWIFAALIVIASLGGSYLYGRMDGKNSCVVSVLKQDLKEAKKDAQDWANRPGTDADIIIRLRNAAEKLRKNGS